MWVLLDTNIIIDALTERQPFYEDASTIFDLAGGEYFDACLTTNSLTDIYYILQKAFGNPQSGITFQIFLICFIFYLFLVMTADRH